MRKLFLMLVLFSAVIGINAQIATENSKTWDNVGLGIMGGVSSPLDMNSVFPFNTTVGLKATKDLTPVVGLQLEAWTPFVDNHFANSNTAFKGLGIGLNGAVNIPNLFVGYKGTPRTFEPSLVLGLGWYRSFGERKDDLYAKTGFDFAFNIGKAKAHSLVLTPSIVWGLKNGSSLQFNHNKANISLMASYIYHFKTSNGTRHFKLYDVGLMQQDLDALQNDLDGEKAKNEALGKALHKTKEALEKCKTQKPKVVKEEVVVEKEVTTLTTTEWVIQFPQGGSTLTKEAKAILNTVPQNVTVDVVGTASPEGNAWQNKALSEKRAAVVTDYLRKIGVTVRNTSGEGVREGESTNRLAIVTVVTE